MIDFETLMFNSMLESMADASLNGLIPFSSIREEDCERVCSENIVYDDRLKTDAPGTGYPVVTAVFGGTRVLHRDEFERNQGLQGLVSITAFPSDDGSGRVDITIVDRNGLVHVFSVADGKWEVLE